MIELDRDVMNSDWTKVTWDLQVNNIYELRSLLDAMGISVRDFRNLPVYKFNIDKIPWLKEL